MPIPKIVLDTNVLVAGLRSNRGASYRLLSLVGTGKFEINLSVPVVLEYEDVLLRREVGIPVSPQGISDILDYLCSAGRHHAIFFLWRPYLKDPQDDMVLELAVKSDSKVIVTFNKRDFAGCERFGIRPLDPREFLSSIGALP
jgi:putative PIN family toxin of toxin-antitoxin system